MTTNKPFKWVLIRTIRVCVKYLLVPLAYTLTEYEMSLSSEWIDNITDGF